MRHAYDTALRCSFCAVRRWMLGSRRSPSQLSRHCGAVPIACMSPRCSSEARTSEGRLKAPWRTTVFTAASLCWLAVARKMRSREQRRETQSSHRALCGSRGPRSLLCSSFGRAACTIDDGRIATRCDAAIRLSGSRSTAEQHRKRRHAQSSRGEARQWNDREEHTRQHSAQRALRRCSRSPHWDVASRRSV